MKRDALIEKGLPAANECERAILGGLVLCGDPQELRRIQSLNVPDFMDVRHRLVFAAILRIAERGLAIDTPVLVEELERELDIVGISYLSSLTDGLPRLVNLEHYAKIVRRKALLRELAKAGHRLMEQCLEASWFQADEILQKFCTFLEQIGEETNPAGGSRITSIDQVGDLFAISTTPVEWFVEGFLPVGGLSVLVGESGALKSTAMLELTCRGMEGKPWAGRSTKGMVAAYLDRENPSSVIGMRRELLGLGETRGLHYWGLWEAEEPPAALDSRLVAFAKKKPFLVFDSLIRFHNANENDPAEMSHVMAGFRRLSALGATVLVIAHKSDKSESAYRGASEIKAAADMMWAVSKREDGKTLDLKCLKNRFELEGSFSVRLERGGFVAADSGAGAELSGLAERARKLIADTPGVNHTKLVELLMFEGASRRDARTTVDALPSTTGPRGAVLYYPQGDTAS